jgi:hypothetical protein
MLVKSQAVMKNAAAKGGVSIRMSDGKSQKILLKWRSVQCHQGCSLYLLSCELTGTFVATGPFLQWVMALRPLVVDFDALRIG